MSSAWFPNSIAAKRQLLKCMDFLTMPDGRLLSKEYPPLLQRFFFVYLSSVKNFFIACAWKT
jgi:hypothetical protein